MPPIRLQPKRSCVFFLFLGLSCLALAGGTSSRFRQVRANAKEFGAVGDGVTDDTSALRAAISSGKQIVIPSGTYRITDTLKVPSNAFIQLTPKTTIRLDTPTQYRYVFQLSDVENVKIEGMGGTLQGDYASHHLGTHYGVYITGTTHTVVVDRLTIQDFPDNTEQGMVCGDGVYVGGETKEGVVPKDITISRCLLRRNHRNDISVTAGEHVLIENCTFDGANTSIDLEANNMTDPVTNIIIKNCTMRNSRTGVNISQDASNVTVEDNEITSLSDADREPGKPNDYEGIHIDCTGPGVLIKDNKIHSGYDGISATRGKATLTGNTITGARRGIWIRYHDVTADHNKILDAWEQGIRIQGNNATVTDNTIEDVGDQTKLFNAKVPEAIALVVVDGSSSGTIVRNTLKDSHPHGESRRLLRLPPPDKGGASFKTDIKP